MDWDVDGRDALCCDGMPTISLHLLLCTLPEVAKPLPKHHTSPSGSINILRQRKLNSQITVSSIKRVMRHIPNHHSFLAVISSFEKTEPVAPFHHYDRTPHVHPPRNKN